MKTNARRPRVAIKLIVAISMSAFLAGCVSTSKWSIYEAESSSSTSEGGVTYYLSIKPERRDFDVDPLFTAGSSGPPYTLNLDATTSRKQKRMKTVRISKAQMILPDGTEYDVLQGRPVSVPAGEHVPWWVNYRSGELPLKFKEGARVVVELHCNAGDGDVVIRTTFIGKKRASTTSIWEYYGSA